MRETELSEITPRKRARGTPFSAKTQAQESLTETMARVQIETTDYDFDAALRRRQ